MALGRHLRLLPPLLLLVVVVSATSAQESCPPDDACRAAAGAAVCSGRGSCVCGYCECSSGISGRFCECDDRSCPNWAGRLCGGPDRGVCQCGRCQCQPGWTGEACDCSTSIDSCIEPGSGRICSNKGNCECGQCRCLQHGEEAYTGQYCEVCPTCLGKCETYRFCVECLAFNTGPLKSSCRDACRSVQITRVDKATVAAASDRLCAFLTPEGCRYNFVYGSGSALRVDRQLQCPEAAPGLTAPSREPGSRSGSGALQATAVSTGLAVLCAATCW